jgi:GT2 family glycosyltransferase
VIDELNLEKRKVRELQSELRELQERHTELEEQLRSARHELEVIRAGIGWRILEEMRRVRVRTIPSGGFAYKALRRMLSGAEAVLSLGLVRTTRTLLVNPKGLPTALRAARTSRLLLNRQYQTWRERHKLSATDSERIAAQIRQWRNPPLVSLLMPVFNTDPEWLQVAVAAVRQQLYPHWELCIVDDASTAPHIAPLLQSIAAEDSRIKLKSLKANEGISGASNHALAMATGEFIGLVDHDDALAPDALYEVVKQLCADNTVDFVYTDHDVRAVDGYRHSPFFKPDWSPDLLLSMNYITHFSVYRRALVEEVGGFRKGFEGSQDYDLLLRVTEHARTIAHIPKPLYSWGQAPASVAANPKAKLYAHEAGRRAVEEALQRRGIAGEVVDGYGSPYRYRVKRKIAGRPLVSIIIPTRDNCRLLERCIQSIEGLTAYEHFEILVVDNQSKEPATVSYLQTLRHRILPFDEPFNFARMNNVAAATAAGEHLLFLNDDTEVIRSDWLEAMLEHSQRPEVGAVGARLLFPNRTLQHAGVVIGIQGKAGHAFWGLPGDSPGYYDQARVIRNYSAVTGACLLMRRAVFEELKGFDEQFAISYNDIDLCLRARERGYLVVYTPYAVLYHHQSASRGAYDAEKDRAYEELLRQRWKSLFEEGDPYYNRNLTLQRFDFSLNT